MTVSDIAILEKLHQFIKEYADSYCCLELLRFFGRHPRARFSRLAVVNALNVNGRRPNIEKALKHLIDKGVLKIYIENNICLYSLTEDESLSSLASYLAKLDWHQWQRIVHDSGSPVCQ